MTICSDTHKPINSIWNKDELLEEWKESIIVSIYKKGDKTECSNYRGMLVLSAAYNNLSNIPLSKLTPYAEKITEDFDVIGQLLIIYSKFVEQLRKNWNSTKPRLSYLCTSRNPMIQVRGMSCIV
jgi:hypothetical protein